MVGSCGSSRWEIPRHVKVGLRESENMVKQVTIACHWKRGQTACPPRVTFRCDVPGAEFMSQGPEVAALPGWNSLRNARQTQRIKSMITRSNMATIAAAR